MENVSVKDLMSKISTTAREKDLLVDIAHKMRVKSISCMVVLHANSRVPIGIITERDLVRVLCDVLDDKREKNDVHVFDFMTSPVVVIQQNATIFDALALTQEKNIRHLPVVNKNGKCVGMLTYSDLAHAHLHVVKLMLGVLGS